MNGETGIVRPPYSAESGIVAELILQSDCGLLHALFGEEAAALLASLQSRPRNPYASENALVIAGEEGEVLGALVGSAAAAMRADEARTAALLLGWYGPVAILRFPRLARAGRALKSLRPDDFYLSHIAVLPGHRGRGLGRQLLLAGEERAARRGARRAVLDVERGNEGAIAFYGRAGYRLASRPVIDLGSRGAFSFFRLEKEL